MSRKRKVLDNDTSDAKSVQSSDSLIANDTPIQEQMIEITLDSFLYLFAKNSFSSHSFISKISNKKFTIADGNIHSLWQMMKSCSFPPPDHMTAIIGNVVFVL